MEREADKNKKQKGDALAGMGDGVPPVLRSCFMPVTSEYE
jgi:hypothetical protein